jgi:phospholipid/cholesterol/gamma-HCH transport system substrate-binding protein
MNAEVITHQLSEISFEINRGHGTISLIIQDSILAENLNQTIANLNKFSKGLTGSDVLMESLKTTAGNAEYISNQLAKIMNKIIKGRGTLGRLIQDSTIAENLNQTILNLKKGSEGLTGADTILTKLNVTAGIAAIISKQLTDMMYNINEGNGTIGRLIRDTIFADNLNQTLINIKQGSQGFDENMIAIKLNFFFRGYYEKKLKQQLPKRNQKKIKSNTVQFYV